MSRYPQLARLRRFANTFASRSLAVFILCSFVATLLPIATTADSSTMLCCVGKTEGHCDSGLTMPKAPPAVTEPMCGLNASAPAPVTLNKALDARSPASRVAEKTSPDAESETSHVSAESISQPCPMDCSACTVAAVRQQKRQKVLVQARNSPSPSTAVQRYDNTPNLFAANEIKTRISPRGPPC